jgi:hypothetical protein
LRFPNLIGSIKNNRCHNYEGEAFKQLPQRGNHLITFKNYQKRIMNPFVIYLDSEAMLENVTDEKGTYQIHKCMNVGLKLVSYYPDLLQDKYI